MGLRIAAAWQHELQATGEHMSPLTTLERRMAREALAQLLAGEQDMTDAEFQAAETALAKLRKPDPAHRLRECLDLAYRSFGHDDEGRPARAASLIKRVRRVLQDTAA
jgi:hypothetical protein